MDEKSIHKLHGFSINLNSSLRIEDIVSKTTSMLVEMIRADGCNIILAKEVREELQIGIIHSGSKPLPDHLNDMLGVSRSTFFSGVPILVEDSDKDPRVHPAFKEYYGRHSLVSVPIIVRGSVIGVIVVYSFKLSFFGEEEIENLLMYGNHLGTAIENSRLIKKLEKAATIDGLTNAYNHTFFRNLLKEKLEGIKPKEELSLIMLDINNFKHINDNFGHLTGDHILREVSEVIRKVLRPGDILARYGGDEFAILLPNCDTKNALSVKIRIEEALKDHLFKYQGFSGLINLSSGIAHYNLDGTSDVELIEVADKRMYQNKRKKTKLLINQSD